MLFLHGEIPVTSSSVAFLESFGESFVNHKITVVFSMRDTSAACAPAAHFQIRMPSRLLDDLKNRRRKKSMVVPHHSCPSLEQFLGESR